MRIVIVGCGRIGAHVARDLADGRHEVWVVDHDADSLARLGPSFPGHCVVGQGFDEDVLRQAEVARADAVAVLTNVDATNFMVAAAVTTLFQVAHVTVRVNDPEFGSLYAELGIHTLDLPELAVQRIRAELAGTGG